ncbi:DUF309 domain-containing protein [Streptomyces sp. NBC_00111]|uniref:DUF309 domain-containing protein n=1 Tax=unclassified Streptomyces TaxID=2593676 RepID=UPI002E32F471|nr:DUF309 domain-containing protein [Streptomyces sp. NBC_01460]
MDESRRDRDEEGRARNARPRDGLGRPLPYGTPGVERQPEGVVRSPDETVREAQRLLDAGMPFHAHEVFEDAWKSGPDGERELWRGLAQMAVGLTHAARGNAAGGARLLRRGATAVEGFGAAAPHGIGVDGLIGWARELADRVDGSAPAGPEGGPGGARGVGGDTAHAAAVVDAATEAPRLRREDRAGG